MSPALREVRRRKRNPWNKSAQRKSDLLKKPAEAKQKHDFYSRLYKQHALDLPRPAIYARALMTNRLIRQYLDQRHPEIVARFETIIAEAKGQYHAQWARERIIREIPRREASGLSLDFGCGLAALRHVNNRQVVEYRPSGGCFSAIQTGEDRDRDTFGG